MCFEVLGTPAVRTADGRHVELTAGKPRALLAHLLLHRDAWVENDTLAEALWPAGRPSSARGNLKTYVHQVRRLLPPCADGSARLVSRRGSYRLVAGPEEVDSCVFERLVTEGREAVREGDPGEAVDLLRQALDLWRGAPYTQVSSTGAEAEAARLQELRKAASDALGDALVAVGEPAEAVLVLSRLTAEEPLREGSWRRLLTALRADGRPADALAAFERARRALADELGTGPSPELLAHHAELLAESAREEPLKPARSPGPPQQPGASGPPETGSPRPSGSGRRRPAVLATLLAGVVAVAVTAGFLLAGTGGSAPSGRSQESHGARKQPRSAAAEIADYPPEVADRRPVPGLAQGSPKSPKLLFGMGHKATTAARSKLVQNSRVGMVTTWYDGRNDLPQFRAWHEQIVPDLYGSGKALHLVIGTWPDQGRGALETRYGPACGQRYPLSGQFLDDMRSLAKSFAGKENGPPLYVSVYHGLEKLACSTQGYRADALNEAYYQALQDHYLKVVKIFHRYAPNARVGLNWDGWEATHDAPESGDGRSMFGWFSRELRASDFVSFNAFEKGRNAAAVRESVAALHRFGLPVMLSYYEPYDERSPSGANAAFEADLRDLFTPESLRKLTADGLFAWSFKTPRLLERSPASYRLAEGVVERYGRPWDGG